MGDLLPNLKALAMDQMGIESSKYRSITGTLRTILKYVFKVSLNFTDFIILSISGKKVFGKAGTKATA